MTRLSPWVELEAVDGRPDQVRLVHGDQRRSMPLACLNAAADQQCVERHGHKEHSTAQWAEARNRAAREILDAYKDGGSR